MSDHTLHIAFALFPGVTQLDFTGPHQVFSRWPGATVTVASAAGGSILADGMTFANLPRLRDVKSCDLICVPGDRAVPGWLVRAIAYLGETTYRTLNLKSKPPLTRFTANIMSRDCILIDAKARKEMGYARRTRSNRDWRR